MEILSFGCLRNNVINLKSYYLKVIVVSSRNAVDLAYKIHGPRPGQGGTPIIVLHGLLGSKKNWETMCKKITSATGKCVVAADIRNHGESPHDPSHTYHDLASDVSQLMNKMTINNANIIGHSMGGRTAMLLALTEPAKVASALVVDISPVSTAGILNNFFPQLINLMKSIKFDGLEFGKARTIARQQIKASGLIEHEGLMSFVIMNIGKKKNGEVGWMCNLDALLNHFENIASFPNTDGKQYNGPVLFIGGDQSNYIPPADITGIRGLFPKAELKYVKGVGHNVHAEDPATFFNMTITFLKNK